MSEILSGLIELSERRARKWTPVQVANLPDPYSLNEPALIGSYSYSLQKSRTRLIRTAGLVKLDDSHVETTPAVARDYLKIKYKIGPRTKKVQEDNIKAGQFPPPNLALPRGFSEGTYIDIKSAYWSIMKVAGWNPDYYPGKWLSPGTPPDDFPFPENKVLRNCLVSSGIPGKILRYDPRVKGDPFSTISPKSPLENLGLFRLITDILNLIASVAQDMGAVYINTDGFIATNAQATAEIIQLIMDFGLTPSIKAEGSGGIKSSGAYKVGSVVSEPYKMRMTDHEVRAVNLPANHKWLQRRFQFWARERMN